VRTTLVILLFIAGLALSSARADETAEGQAFSSTLVSLRERLAATRNRAPSEGEPKAKETDQERRAREAEEKKAWAAVVAMERQRATAHMASLDAETAAAGTDYDPRQDPIMWRIYQHAVPTKVKGLILKDAVAGGDKSLFYARIPKRQGRKVPQDDERVYFYDYIDTKGIFRLAGFGVVKKLQREVLGSIVVEAEIRSFRYVEQRKRDYNPDWLGFRTTLPLLAAEWHPDRARWFMSTELAGAKALALSKERLELLSSCHVWLGMDRDLMFAVLGWPWKVEQLQGTTTYHFSGMEPRSVEVRDGKVTGIKGAAVVDGVAERSFY